jgi:hypothetical protein
MSTNPDDLRQRAEAANVAGDETLAEALNTEADDLESAPPPKANKTDEKKGDK